MLRKAFLVLTGVLLAAFLLELSLRFLPVATGVRLMPVDSRNPILHGTPGFQYTYSIGWNFRMAQRGVLNNWGFRAGYDYVPETGSIAVIGDSFIDGGAISPEHTIFARINARGTTAYGIASGGFSLADYLAAVDWVAGTLGSHTFAILLTEGDITGSTNRTPGTHFVSDNGLRLTDRPPLSSVELVLNESRLFRYFFDNLKFFYRFSLGTAGRQKAMHAAGESGGCAEAPARVMDFLLSEFRRREAEGRRILFLVDPRSRSGGLKCERDVDTFAAAAVGAGLGVVSLEEAFAEAKRRGRRLDFKPVDMHWNEEAHRIAAEVLLRHLRGNVDGGRATQPE